MFDSILGQEIVKKRLSSAIKSNRITNAYIFTGPEGVGKKMIAEAFASSLIGINAQNSPDYILIEAKKGENSIKIDQIRKLNSNMGLKPYSNYKIYLINDAEKMTVQAQNALLKTLEEPSSYGIIILITRNEQALLQTIRSRCTEVKFSPLNNIDIKKILETKGIDENTATVSSIFSRGSASVALEISKDEEVNEIRDLVESFIGYMVIDKNKFEVTRISEYMKNYTEHTEWILELLKIYIRDAILYREGVGTELLINIDRMKIIRKMAVSATVAKLGRAMSIIEETETKLAANCNFNTTIQAMALNIYEVVK
ncbi:DNA polymerase-3 subunit delta' [Peptostreptococcus russellii]|uniref:DNA polymerase III subunit delta' n=1 Tax=Peptostreptococcus russellii TaxID=215200 RepID=A0A1H8JCC3_9FIRM|nr:AAA family ATPase [Peptostreptococcus russellii]SEN78432.1 DNA polymerase-3 subunit delta' [Peptostreptococcus russellii]